MISNEDINDRAERMRDGLVKAYGVKANDLSAALDRTARHLPKRARAAVMDVLEARGIGHPKLLRRLDPARLSAAERTLEAHLKTVDRSAMRRGAILDWAAEVAFYIFVVGSGFVIWLYAAGHL
jgi:hypothetical protein